MLDMTCYQPQDILTGETKWSDSKMVLLTYC